MKIRWGADGVPFSTAFDDQYFCKDDGYAEGLHVCCGGNSLRERFQSLDPAVRGTFVILETGFGTGLDMCCAWEMWEAGAPLSWQLHFVSIELFPLSPEDVRRALTLWPRLASYREQLLSRYEPRPGQMKDLSFQDGRVRLTLFFDDAEAALCRIKAEGIIPQGADACFLDGFAPSKNPAMWSEEVLRGVASLSRPGTTFSTFTVAGHVRRGLEAAGFAVRKAPGHGKKKQILTGVFK